MGQLLSIPFVLGGLTLVIQAYRHPLEPKADSSPATAKP